MSPLYAFDLEFLAHNPRLIGIDEAGRGALAGPVVVAAVSLDYSLPLAGINDSKKLTPLKREKLFDLITGTALAYSIVEIGADFIDAHNILQATLRGMRDAVAALAPEGALCLIDGNQLPSGLKNPAQTVIHGDNLSACIAAASILAKVHRDRLMRSQDPLYPLYGFAQNKGYGTAKHLQALWENGCCELHRKSFYPVSAITSSHN